MEKHKKKAKKYCAVFNCLSKDCDPNVTFFRLPKDDERRKQWLELIKRPDLDRPDVRHKSYTVCSLHFEDSVISRLEIVKLLPNSLPTKYVHTVPRPSHQNTSQKNNRRSFSSRNISTQTDDSGTYLQLAKRLPQQSGSKLPRSTTKYDTPSTSTSSTEINKLEERGKRPLSETDEDALSKRKLTVGFYKLMQWQINLKNKYKGDYSSTEFKKFALNLYYSNPQTYRSLKTFLKLPDESTLSRSNANKILMPGLEDWTLKCFSTKLQSLPDEAKYCTVCVGTMALKQNLYYDIRHDDITGLHNMYGKVTSEIASNAYMVIVQGITVKWDLPIAYAFVASNDHQQLDTWINNIIIILLSIGLRVMAIVYDLDSELETYTREVKNITTERPYFTIDGHKIYHIFDVTQLLVQVRNDLLNYDFYNADQDRITWEYIKMVHTIQKNKKLQMLPNITDAHINPEGMDKLEVKLVAQVFSLKVFGVLNTLICSKLLPEEARATAEFVKLMNDLFSVLSASCKSSISNKDLGQILDNAQKVLKNLSVVNKETSTFTDIQTLKSFQITLQAITMLSKDLKKEDIKHYFTYSFTREEIKTLCHKIQSQRNDGKYPTPIQFRRAFSRYFYTCIFQKSPSDDCHDDLFDLLSRGDAVILKTISAIDYGQNLFGASPVMVSLDGDVDYRFDVPKDAAVKYVTAYILYKCSQKHQCDQLDAFMQDRIDLLNFKMHPHFREFNKNCAFYGHLKVPPDYLVKKVKDLEKNFLKIFVQFSLKNPATTLFTLLQTFDFDTPCPCFPVQYFIKLFIRFRIFNVIKRNVKHLKEDKYIKAIPLL